MRRAPGATMLAALLAQLAESNPRECALLRELDSLDISLDELLISQNNSTSFDPAVGSHKLRLHIFNSYTKQVDHGNEHMYLYETPTGFTLHLRGYEVDEDGNTVHPSESGLLCRYFRQIMLCTPDRTVLWDRDGIHDFHKCAKRRTAGWSPLSNSLLMGDIPPGLQERDVNDQSSQDTEEYNGDSDGFQTSEHNTQDMHYNSDVSAPCIPEDMNTGDPDATLHDSTRRRGQKRKRSDTSDPTLSCLADRYSGVDPGMGGRGGDPGPFNGYDELQVSQICSNECQVVIYLFPAEYSTICTISDYLKEFLSFVNGGKPITDSSQQLSFHRVVSMIISYAYDQSLIYQREDGTYFFMDEALAEVLGKTEVSCIEIHDLPNVVLPHILPPKPIKIIYDVVLNGEASASDRFVDIQLDNMVRLDGKVMMTDYDIQIEGLMNEIRNGIHVRSAYSMYARDPMRFVEYMLNDYSVDKMKPLTPEVMYRSQNVLNSWIPRAIDKYMSWYERPVYQVLYGSLNNFSKDSKNEKLQGGVVNSPEGNVEQADKPNDKIGRDGQRCNYKSNHAIIESYSKDGSTSKSESAAPVESVIRDGVDSSESYVRNNISADMVIHLKGDAPIDHREGDCFNDYGRDLRFGGSTYFNNGNGNFIMGDTHPSLLHNPTIIANPVKGGAALANDANSSSSGLNAVYNVDYAEHSNGLHKHENTCMMAESVMINGCKKYEMPNGLKSGSPVSDITSGVTHTSAFQNKMSMSNGTNGPIFCGDMSFHDSFSGETHFNLPDHYVAEGSQTMGDEYPVFGSRGNSFPHVETKGPIENGVFSKLPYSIC